MSQRLKSFDDICAECLSKWPSCLSDLTITHDYGRIYSVQGLFDVYLDVSERHVEKLEGVSDISFIYHDIHYVIYGIIHKLSKIISSVNVASIRIDHVRRSYFDEHVKSFRWSYDKDGNFESEEDYLLMRDFIRINFYNENYG